VKKAEGKLKADFETDDMVLVGVEGKQNTLMYGCPGIIHSWWCSSYASDRERWLPKQFWTRHLKSTRINFQKALSKHSYLDETDVSYYWNGQIMASLNVNRLAKARVVFLRSF